MDYSKISRKTVESMLHAGFQFTTYSEGVHLTCGASSRVHVWGADKVTVDGPLTAAQVIALGAFLSEACQ